MNWCLTISDYNPFCILFSQSTLWVYYNIVVFQFLNLLMTIYYIIHTDVFLLFLFRMLMGKRPFADIFYWILNSVLVIYQNLLYRYGDRIVAIKVLNCGNTSEERTVLESRFVREVAMMSRVKHENLVKVRLTDNLCSLI